MLRRVSLACFILLSVSSNSRSLLVLPYLEDFADQAYKLLRLHLIEAAQFHRMVEVLHLIDACLHSCLVLIGTDLFSVACSLWAC